MVKLPNFMNKGNSEEAPQPTPAPEQPEQPTAPQQPFVYSAPTAGQSALEQEAQVKKLSRIVSAAVAVAIVAACYAAFTAVTTGAQLADLKSNSTSIVVATTDIAPGTVISADMVANEDVPNYYVNEGSVANVDDVVGKTAITKIYTHGQVNSSNLAGAANASTLATAIDKDMVAVSLSVDAESGLAGLLRQGDIVSIVSVMKGSSGATVAKTIVEGCEIVALDTQLSNSGNSSYSTVTLEMSMDNALKFTAAREGGNVSLALHSAAGSADIK